MITAAAGALSAGVLLGWLGRDLVAVRARARRRRGVRMVDLTRPDARRRGRTATSDRRRCLDP